MNASTSHVGNPYVGPRAYDVNDPPLYGRDAELRHLLDLLIPERIVLFYAPSGAGKTSLIQAKLIPALQSEDFDVLPIMRVNLPLPTDLPAGQPAVNRYAHSAMRWLESDERLQPADRLSEERLLTTDLSSYLGEQLPKRDRDQRLRVLIWDQFEEILTLDPTDRDAKIAFFRQLGTVLRDRTTWALFSLREDHLAGLDPYRSLLPTHLQSTFRMDLLREAAARQAVQLPAANRGVTFADETATLLVNDLRRVQVQLPDGSVTSESGSYVEPVQLQVVCFRLWDALAPGTTRIDPPDLTALGDVDHVLGAYYDDVVASASTAADVPERVVRDWCDHRLITEQNTRGQVQMEPERSDGLDNRAIRKMEDWHLVRGDRRLGTTWFELAHDRLIEPVRLSNRSWREAHLSGLQRQAILWDREHRPDRLLLRGAELDAEEKRAATHGEELTRVEAAFLKSCRELRTQEQERLELVTMQAVAQEAKARLGAEEQLRHETQRRLVAETDASRRLQRRLILVAAFALLALLTAGLAIHQSNQANTARGEADEAGNRARQQAEIVGIQAAAGQSLYQHNLGQDAQAALLAREAYLADQATGGTSLELVDAALRTALGAPFLGHILDGHTDRVTTVAFAQEGTRVVSGGADGSVLLWELSPLDTTGRVLRDDGAAPVWSVAVSPDGQSLAVADDDGVVQLWNLTQPDADPVLLPGGHQGRVRSVSFSPDGRFLASGGDDGTVRLWNPTRPRANPTVVQDQDGWVAAIAFTTTTDSLILASAGQDGLVRTRNVRDPGLLNTDPTILTAALGPILSLAFSPDGRTIAAGGVGTGSDGAVRLWDLSQPNAASSVLDAQQLQVLSVAFSPDGKTLAAGGWNGRLALWDIQESDAAPRIVTAGNVGNVGAVAISPDGQTLVSGNEDRTVRLWDLRSPAATPVELRRAEGRIRSIAFRPGGTTLAAGAANGEAGEVFLWDPGPPDSAPVLLADDVGAVRAVAFDPEGTLLAVGGDDGVVRLIDPERVNDPPRLLPGGHQGYVRSLAFSSDSRFLASGGVDATVRVWDLSQPDPQPAVLVDDGSVNAVAFSPDGRLLAVAGCAIQRPAGRECAAAGAVRLWDLSESEASPGASPVILTNQPTAAAAAVVFSPDGATLAAGSWDGSVRLWAMAHLEAPPRLLPGFSREVLTVAFSPDSTSIAAAGGDRVVRLWDLRQTDPSPIVLSGHRDSVWTLAFGPDGRLATGGDDSVVRVYIADTATLADLVCERVGRNLAEEEWRQFYGDAEYQQICPNLPALTTSPSPLGSPAA